MREEITNVSYTTSWLTHTRKALLEDPDDVLHHWTHANYSGGLTGWEEFVDNVYFKPASYEESLLRGEVYDVLRVALDNAFRSAETKKYDGTWSVFRGMDLAEAYRLAHMVAAFDPRVACAAKLRLDRIARRMGTSLGALADTNFQMFMGPTGIRW